MVTTIEEPSLDIRLTSYCFGLPEMPTVPLLLAAVCLGLFSANFYWLAVCVVGVGCVIRRRQVRQGNQYQFVWNPLRDPPGAQYLVMGDINRLNAILEKAFASNQRVVVRYPKGQYETALLLEVICRKALIECELVRSDVLQVVLTEPAGIMIITRDTTESLQADINTLAKRGWQASGPIVPGRALHRGVFLTRTVTNFTQKMILLPASAVVV